MTTIALDIGGANLKAADGQGYAASHYFPLWRKPEELAAALRAVLSTAPPCTRVVAAMTGELADCYRTKAEGVAHIAAALAEAAEQRSAGVYLTDGRIVSPAQARQTPLRSAAANWHALACFAGRYASKGTALVIDIGSTTSDLIPLRDGRPAPQGWTDPDRLVSGELVYTGVERSPICAVTRALPWRGVPCATAHELFSTTWDAYLLLGALPEEHDSTHTADGRPATREFAIERLARAVCADREMFSAADAQAAAQAVESSQLAQLGVAAQGVLARLATPPQTVILSGRGEFLGRKLVERLGLAARVVSLHEQLGPTVSRCATAHALAVLAREER